MNKFTEGNPDLINDPDLYKKYLLKGLCLTDLTEDQFTELKTKLFDLLSTLPFEVDTPDLFDALFYIFGVSSLGKDFETRQGENIYESTERKLSKLHRVIREERLHVQERILFDTVETPLDLGDSIEDEEV